MSVLRKKPFIEELLSQLSADELTRLSTVIDQKGTPVLMSLPLNLSNNPVPFSAPVSVDDKIKLVDLMIGANSVYTGILIYHSTSYCAFIGTNALESDIIKCFKLNVSTRKAEPINEKLTADELRRVLDDVAESKGSGADKIEGTNVLSTGASLGQVLTANGSGAASWSDVPEEVVHIIKTLGDDNSFDVTAAEFTAAYAKPAILTFATEYGDQHLTKILSDNENGIQFANEYYRAYFNIEDSHGGPTYHGVVYSKKDIIVEVEYDEEANESTVKCSFDRDYIPSQLTVWDSNLNNNENGIKITFEDIDDGNSASFLLSPYASVGTSIFVGAELSVFNISAEIYNTQNYISFTVPNVDLTDESVLPSGLDARATFLKLSTDFYQV